MKPSVDPKIIVALDFATAGEALVLAQQLDPQMCRVKVGKELFTCAGPSVIEALHKLNFQVFLDLKFFDIPHTVSRAVLAAQALNVWMLTLHASGGPTMLRAAHDILRADLPAPLLIAVTVLTSWQAEDLLAVGVTRSLTEHVQQLAQLSMDAGLQGCVCSGHEAAALRQQLGTSALLVTPGIRSSAVPTDDQQRILTAAQALHQGASYLVIGRPITQAADPLRALADFHQQIQLY
jgi:orotidine-5'-phosphate decarboxylase